ncbi:MAG: type VI secretion system baseplate subunit TssK [Alphaproteobacteria bacterium]|nr:type VI secretion system baseplate subunit TssK [Alphaproteobacteria bacterium]
MRFDESIHWNNGLFMQPHHLQYMQRYIDSMAHANRQLISSYPYGLIDFVPDLDALSGDRVVIKRLSAVMPDGTEISQPGNCVIHPLDLKNVLNEQVSSFKVYLGIPVWSEFDANLSENEKNEKKRRFLTVEKSIRDENTGDDEISVVTRRLNVSLLTEFDDMEDMVTIPLMKINVLINDNAEKRLECDEKFIPPFIVVSNDSSLVSLVSNLMSEVRRCRDKLLNDLMLTKFTSENFSGAEAYNTLQYRVLNLYENRLSMEISGCKISPFELYFELRSFLAELMGLHPLNEIKEIQNYNHLDCSPQFYELVNDIQSMIMSEGGASYIALKLNPIDDGDYLFTEIQTQHIVKASEFYLAVRADLEDRRVIQALEKGDTFKIINPRAKMMRIRGIKLSEMRYPPRFLPNLNNTLWFKLDVEETPKTWQDICSEHGILVDYAKDLFPSLEATLFLTIVDSETRN